MECDSMHAAIEHEKKFVVTIIWHCAFVLLFFVDCYMLINYLLKKKKKMYSLC